MDFLTEDVLLDMMVALSHTKSSARESKNSVDVATCLKKKSVQKTEVKSKIMLTLWCLISREVNFVWFSCL